MPWTMNDYPDSLKNLDEITRKKAIDMANAMLDEGYDEGRAIPIATSEAKKWKQNASKQEQENYKKNGQPTKRSEKDKRYENNPERLDERELVEPHKDGWAVKSEHANKASYVFENKQKAIERAREIADNKDTEVKVENKKDS